MAKDKVEIEIKLEAARARKEFKKFSKDAAHGLKDVKGESKKTAKEFKRVSGETKGLTSALGKLKAASAALAAAFVAFKGLKGALAFLGDAAKEAEKEEWAMRGLHQVIVSMKRDVPGFEKSIQDLADALERQTGYGNDAILMAAKFLSTYKEISNDVMPRALQLTLDIARGWGVDLPQAANMVGKAAMGMTGELRRYGITVDQGTYKSRGFIGVMEQIEEQVKGQAAAYRETTTGLKEFVAAVWGDVKKQFGYIVNQVLDPFKEAVGEVLAGLAGDLKTWREGVDLKTWAADAAQKFKELGDNLSQKVIPALESFIPKLQEGLDTARKTFDAVNQKLKELLLLAKLSLDAFMLFWDIASGQWIKTPGGVKRAYDDLAQGIKNITKANKETAQDVEKAPIEPQVETKDSLEEFNELWDYYKNLKLDIEKEPIKIRVVREVHTVGGPTTYEYEKDARGGFAGAKFQVGGFVPGMGFKDSVRAMLTPGEGIIPVPSVSYYGKDFVKGLIDRTIPREGLAGARDYLTLDLRLGEKSYPLTVQKEDVVDQLMQDVRHHRMTRG